MTERLTQLLKLYESDGHDPFVTYGISLEYAKDGDHKAAVQWLDKTLELDRHYHYAYFQKAQQLSELGEDEQARETAERGLGLAREVGDEKAAGELGELLMSL